MYTRNCGLNTWISYNCIYYFLVNYYYIQLYFNKVIKKMNVKVSKLSMLLVYSMTKYSCFAEINNNELKLYYFPELYGEIFITEKDIKNKAYNECLKMLDTAYKNLQLENDILRIWKEKTEDYVTKEEWNSIFPETYEN